MSGRYDDLQVIGDELYFERELVAILTDNAPATLRGRFVDLLHDGEETSEDENDKAKAPAEGVDEYDQVLDDLERAAREYSKGGLLRMSDLPKIIARLKEAE